MPEQPSTSLNLEPLTRELILHIYRTPLAARQAAKRALLLETPAKPPTPAPERYLTFNELWELCTGNHDDPESTYASPLVSLCLLREILKKPSSPYAPEAQDLLALQAALNELRLAGITAEGLRLAIKRQKTLNLSGISKAYNADNRELTKLQQILLGYEESLKQTNLRDDADRARQTLLKLLQRELPPAISNLKQVILEEEIQLFQGNLELLNALAANDVQIQINFPWEPERAQLYSLPESNLRYLEAEALSTIQVNLVKKSLAPKIALQEFSNPFLQARYLADEVANLLQRGVAPTDICVLTLQPFKVGRQILHEFQKRHIPALLSEKPPLGAEITSKLLLTALKLKDTHFKREDFIEVYLKFSQKSDLEFSRLAFIKSLRKQGLHSAKTHDYPAEEQTLQEFLQELKAQAPLQDYLAFTRKLLARLTLPLGSTQREPATTSSTNQDLTTCLTALEASCTFLSQLNLELSPWQSNEFQTWLASLLSIPPPENPVPKDNVLITTPERLGNAQFAYVFLSDLTLESFPRTTKTNHFLTPKLRSTINSLCGLKLLPAAIPEKDTPLTAYYREDLWSWVEILSSAQNKLYITYHKPQDLKDMGKSPLIDDLLNYATSSEISQSQDPLAIVQPTNELRELPAPKNSLTPFPDYELHHQAITYLLNYLKTTSQSINSLDSLATCIFKYFAEHLLKLQTRETNLFNLNPREESILAHQLLHLSYEQLLTKSLDKHKISLQELTTFAESLVEQQLKRALEQKLLHPLWLKALKQKLIRLVVKDIEQNLNEKSPTESRALVSFYQFSPLSLKHPQKDYQLTIHGHIDRIDISRLTNSLKTSTYLLAAFDYKRTTPKRQNQLQLATYQAIIARDFPLKTLKEQLSTTSSQLLTPKGTDETCQYTSAWLNLQNHKKQYLTETPTSPTEPLPQHTFLQHLEKIVWEKLAPLLAGNLHPNPESLTLCTHCNFKPLCQQHAQFV